MLTPQSAQCSENLPPNVTSLKNAKMEEKKAKALLHILPKLPSSDSLTNSPGPASPGMYI